MTLQEILAMPPRERDAMVAEKVMGWTSVSIRDLCGYPPIVEAALKHIPKYSFDAAADLDVHRVACSWEQSVNWRRKTYKYFRALSKVLWFHMWGELPGNDDLLSITMSEEYQPGDYSIAALAVVMEGKP